MPKLWSEELLPNFRQDTLEHGCVVILECHQHNSFNSIKQLAAQQGLRSMHDNLFSRHIYPVTWTMEGKKKIYLSPYKRMDNY